jgi:hypothetical protein
MYHGADIVTDLLDDIQRHEDYVSAKLCPCVRTKDIQTWSERAFVIAAFK